MKALLEFNLPEEEEEHLTYINAVKYRRALEEIDLYLRNKIKHDINVSKTSRKAYENTRTELYNLLNDYEIKLY